MNPYDIIHRYYPEDNECRRILISHSESVQQKALSIIRAHPELGVDERFVAEAALLHDLGVFMTDAPGIFCFGTHPYICHGTLGAELLRADGYPRHALVCERHTGAGISLPMIIAQGLPLPHRDLLPVSIEEQIICFADKFFSKTHLDREKSVEEARNSLRKHGEAGQLRFDTWCERFL